jgi:hypothetical protein
MNNLTIITLEAIGIGILTLIIGRIIFYSGVNKDKRKEIEKYNKHLSLTLFIIGFILHFIMEIGGLNKWYCDKQCTLRLKDIAKIKQ